MLPLLFVLVCSTISGNDGSDSGPVGLSRRAPFGIAYKAVSEDDAKISSLFGSSITAQTTLLTTVSVGNPPQDLDILLDTGSSLFWVIKADGCQGVINNNNGLCPGEHKYNHSRSSLFKKVDYYKSTSYAYGSGTNPNTALRCTIHGYDYLSIGQDQNGKVQYENHPICEADYIKLANSYEADLPYDGIMGLAPLADDAKAIVYVGNTFLLEYGAVSFWYNRQRLHNLNYRGQFGVTSREVNLGFVTFGKEIHPDLQKNLIVSVPIAAKSSTSASSWTVELQSIGISGSESYGKDARVLVDSGVGFANIPKTLWESLYRSFNPVQDSEGDYIIPCDVVNNMPAIEIRFTEAASTNILLTGPMQVLVKTDCRCGLLFSPTSDAKMLWGSLFLSNFYTTFDFDVASPKLHFYETNSQTETNCF